MDEQSSTRQCFKEISSSLISRDFQKCELKCREQLKALISHPESEGYQDDLEQIMNGLMQSLAEQGKWEEVLPLLNDVYGTIENMPVVVIKNCMLLHAKVREYTTCTTVYNIWLRDKEFRRESVNAEWRRMLVDIFIRKVLIPQDKIDQINSYLQRAQLELTTINHLKQCYDQMIGEMKRKMTENKQSDNKTSSKTANDGVEDAVQSKLDSIVEKILKALYTLCNYIRTSPQTHKVLGCISGLLVFYFILTTVNIVDSHSTEMNLSNTLINFITYVKYKIKPAN